MMRYLTAALTLLLVPSSVMAEKYLCIPSMVFNIDRKKSGIYTIRRGIAALIHDVDSSRYCTIVKGSGYLAEQIGDDEVVDEGGCIKWYDYDLTYRSDEGDYWHLLMRWESGGESNKYYWTMSYDNLSDSLYSVAWNSSSGDISTYRCRLLD